MSKKRIAVLDGIRGMAFLFVILGHVSNYYGQFFTGFAIVGVWLFFVLSAFLLTLYFLRDPKRAGNPEEWLIYALRRIIRILPPYLLVLLIYFFGKYLITSSTDIFKHLILISGTGHFWTIPVEIKYYLILPFVVVVLVYFFKLNAVLSIFGLIIFLAIQQYLVPAAKMEVSSINLINYISVFVTGSVTALLHVKISQRKLSNNIGKYLEALSLLIIFLVLITVPAIWSRIFYAIPNNYFYKYFIVYGILFSVLILSILNGKGTIKSFFENRIFVGLGKVSYSGYLIHPIILNKVYNLLPKTNDVVKMAISIPLIFIFAAVMYNYVEKPCMKVNIIQRR
jgi:peptidoglycan/LPS O-acetylase OafA/YrhL